MLSVVWIVDCRLQKFSQELPSPPTLPPLGTTFIKGVRKGVVTGMGSCSWGVSLYPPWVL